MLFRRRAIVETLMRSLMVVEVEIGARPNVQPTYCVILVEIDVFVLYAAPKAFAADVVEGAAAAIHADLNVDSKQAVKASAVNCAPWSVLKILGQPLTSA